MNVNPFKGELSLNNALNQIKFRYFVSDQFAVRVGFTANSKKITDNQSSPYGTNPSTYSDIKRTSLLGTNLGVEKHFKGTKRLSPYIGAEVALAVKSSSEDITYKGSSVNSDTKIKGAWLQEVNSPNYPISYKYIERGFTQVGLNLVTGFDFYMAKNFYFGYEIAFGVSSTKFKDIDITSKNSSGGSFPDQNSDSDLREFSFGPNLMNGIRIGYVF